jgi:hypothetical protein
MRQIGLAVACMLLVAGAAVAQLSTGPPAGATVIDGRKAGGYVEIDGRKNPEQIPKYLAWRSAFQALASLYTQHLTQIIEEALPMSDTEKVVVFQAARQQLERDAACARRQTVRADALTSEGVQFEKVIEAMKPIVMDCRQQVLDAQEHLLAALRPETQAALTAWVDSKRATIHALVPKQELEDFRKPR